MDEETAVWRDQAIEWQQRATRLAGQLAAERTINLASGCPDCGVHHGCNEVVAERDRLRAVVGDAMDRLREMTDDLRDDGIHDVADDTAAVYRILAGAVDNRVQLDVSGDMGDDRAAMNIDPDPPGFTPDPSFRFIPPTCPTCGTPHTLTLKFNGGDPIAFYQPDCDCDDDPAVFPMYMSGTIVGPVERIVAADHALDDEVGTYEVETGAAPEDHDDN